VVEVVGVLVVVAGFAVPVDSGQWR
jgi:hypothetical protein